MAQAGSDELRLLEFFRANASVGGKDMNHIILREDPRKMEAVEEFLHGTQHRLELLAQMTIVEAEIHVKRFMIRHRKLLGISAEDAAIVDRMLGGG